MSRLNASRFIEAQAPVYERVVEELTAGHKRTHWMWFIFPQLASLGHSRTARFFGLEGLAQARKFADHNVLGPRLRECCALMLSIQGRTATQILGSPDDLKLCSCVTLFEAAQRTETIFGEVTDRLYGGKRDRLTLIQLQREHGSASADPVETKTPIMTTTSRGAA